jgi:hypothetical protein
MCSLAMVWALVAGWQLAPAANEGVASATERARPALPTPGNAGALPESVLASIGTSRTVSVADFRAAWSRAKPSAPLASLTPDEARQFLGLLIDRELLAEEANRQSWAWTPQEASRYRALRDRLMVGAALDSALEEARKSFATTKDTVSDAERLGIDVRDRTVARMSVRFDEALLERLAKAWARLPRPVPGTPVREQLEVLSALPKIDASDSARVLAISGEETYRVSDLVDAWRRLSIAYRPRIDDASQLRDLVRNGLFEHALRRAAEARGLDRRPDIAAALTRAREEIAIAHLAEREVYGRIRADSLTLHRYYERNRDTWTLPLRVRVVRLVLEDRPTAERMAFRLRDAAEAESLAALARRQGLDYTAEWSLAADSARFAAALKAGVGAVIGPEPMEDAWMVARVTEVLPGRSLGYEEVRDRVRERWTEEEAQRLTRVLCDRLAKRTRVIRNDRAVALHFAGSAVGDLGTPTRGRQE